MVVERAADEERVEGDHDDGGRDERLQRAMRQNAPRSPWLPTRAEIAVRSDWQQRE